MKQTIDPKHHIDETLELTANSTKSALLIKIENYFKLKERKSTWITEIRAGCVVFVTVAYILAVNASILSTTGGPCKYNEENENAFFDCLETVRLDLITATAASSCISCFIMGCFANLPIALAPGMGINAYFVYSVVGPWFDPKPINYETALFAVFVEGWIFLLLSITGARTYIAKLIPTHLKSAITAGIGAFLALIGFQADQGIGLVVSHPVTNITLGGCTAKHQDCDINGLNCGCNGGLMESGTTWLGIIGFIIIINLMSRNVKGSIFIGILFVSIVSWIRGTSVTYFPNTDEGNSRYDIFKQVISFHSIEKTLGACFRNIDLHDDIGDIIVALFTFLYVDLLDTTGTLYSMAEFGGYLDENGDFEKSKYAFSTDAIGTIIGSMLGTSPITSVIESGAGIQEGGRTGITAIVVSILFMISLFLSPIFASIPPYATGPALIVIGSLMFKSVLKIKWDNIKEACPAFVTIAIMPFTYSIAYGIISGLCVHFIMVIFDKLFDCCCPRKINNINNSNKNSMTSDIPLIANVAHLDYSSLTSQ